MADKKDYYVNLTLEPKHTQSNNVTISFYNEDTGETIIDSTQIVLTAWSVARDQQIIYSGYSPRIISQDISGNYIINDLEHGDYNIDWQKRT